MRVAFSPIYRYPHLPEKHRFPMEKYDVLYEQLIYEGTITEEDVFSPDILSEETLLRTHSEEYWYKLKHGKLSRNEIRAMGFPYTPLLIERSLHIAGGTLQCARYALQGEVALNIAGGTHHAFRDRGEGFCLLNDFAIAINELLYTGEIQQALIIDLDVHQGNGTAAIFEGESRVFTLSVHGAKNYPLRKTTSDWDIGVDDGIEDQAYLSIVEQTLKEVFQRVKPDLVCYLSGVDVIEGDKLGRLSLSIQGCRRRDELVFEYCKQHSVVPCVSMGGGYSKRLANIIEAHANTYRVARQVFG